LGGGRVGAILDRAGLPAATMPEAGNLSKRAQVMAIHLADRQLAQIMAANALGGKRRRATIRP
jgi:hypothetical protein